MCLYRNLQILVLNLLLINSLCFGLKSPFRSFHSIHQNLKLPSFSHSKHLNHFLSLSTSQTSSVIHNTHKLNDLNHLIPTAASWSSIFQVMINIMKTTPMIINTLMKELVVSVLIGDILLFVMAWFTYKKVIRLVFEGQQVFMKRFSLRKSIIWEKSVFNFFEERIGLGLQLIGWNYIARLLIVLLGKFGLLLPKDLAVFISKISFIVYTTQCIDNFKSKFLHDLFPNLADNRRQSYVVDRSSSVTIWFLGMLITCDMISNFLKVPLSSIVAFGGAGGLLIGLSVRDIASNFLGGLLLLFNEPFTPGDQIIFKSNGNEVFGRVERIGWGQTRVRGRDTRPTYVPNSQFVQTAVTNMERITHRKFETIVPIRFQDHPHINDIVNKIKDNLKKVPKLDVLSQPYRVSFIKIGQYSLDIEVTCYFATKSIDEFLTLQQLANLEIIKVVYETGAQLAMPTTHFQLNNPMTSTPNSIIPPTTSISNPITIPPLSSDYSSL